MTFANWNPNSVSVIYATWFVFVHHLPFHKKGIWYKLRQALDIFCEFYVLSIKFNYAAPFSLLKLLQSWFHPSLSSVLDPVKARFLFCDCLSLLFINTPLSLLQCLSLSKFSPLLSSWPKLLRAFESSSGWSFSPAFIPPQVFSTRLKWLSGLYSSPYFLIRGD